MGAIKYDLYYEGRACGTFDYPTPLQLGEVAQNSPDYIALSQIMNKYALVGYMMQFVVGPDLDDVTKVTLSLLPMTRLFLKMRDERVFYIYASPELGTSIALKAIPSPSHECYVVGRSSVPGLFAELDHRFGYVNDYVLVHPDSDLENQTSCQPMHQAHRPLAPILINLPYCGHLCRNIGLRSAAQVDLSVHNRESSIVGTLRLRFPTSAITLGVRGSHLEVIEVVQMLLKELHNRTTSGDQSLELDSDYSLNGIVDVGDLLVAGLDLFCPITIMDDLTLSPNTPFTQISCDPYKSWIANNDLVKILSLLGFSFE